MLHTVIHRQRCWRQSGYLICQVCCNSNVSAAPKAAAAAIPEPVEDKTKKADALSEVEANPYFAKYAAKLRAKQQANPAEFEEKLKKGHEMKIKSQEDAVAAAKEMEERVLKDRPLHKEKKLSDVMKTELIGEKSAKEIGELWNEYHSQKDVIHAIIPADEYLEMKQRAAYFPRFVYPLPRNEGYEFILSQWDGNEVHFTPLIAFQMHGENAPVCLDILHYTELAQEKRIVLMTGEPDTNILSVYECQLLALQMKMYYGIGSGVRFNHVRLFNNAPNSFQYVNLIKQFENYKKDVRFAKELKESMS